MLKSSHSAADTGAWLASAVVLSGALLAAPAAQAAADPATGPVQSTVAPAPAPPITVKDASLSAFGITLYGTIDIGLAYLNHGAPLSAYYGAGLPFQIQKYSNRSIFSVAPNGLSQSKIGLSGTEPLNPDTAVVFRVETGFQPTSGALTDGPKSLVVDNGRPLNRQITSADSSRAGQPLEGAAYIGLASKTFGVLTFGRQNGLLLDDLIRYDPQAQSQAFSPIGYSGVAGGGGNTEDARLDSSVKYAVRYKAMHLTLLHQFGNEGDIPGGAEEIDLGGDVGGLSVDAAYAHIHDAVSLSSLTAAQAAAAPGTLAATVSDTVTWSAYGRYVTGPAKFFVGYEHIGYNNPSHPLSPGQEDIGGYTLSVINNAAYLHQKVLQVSWVGLRYALTKALDVTGAYYRYDQNSYKGNGCANTSASSCRGALNAGSIVLDYKLAKRFDVYGGINYSGVAGGLAAGYLKRSVLSQMVGVRFSF